MRIPIPWLTGRGLPSEAEENAASITAVPLDQLPVGPARSFLLAEAAAGKDVNAYRPIGSSVWNVWYGPLAPRYDARIEASVWHRFWPAMAALAAEYEARRRQEAHDA